MAEPLFCALHQRTTGWRNLNGWNTKKGIEDGRKNKHTAGYMNNRQLLTSTWKRLWRWISLFNIFPGSQNHSPPLFWTNSPDTGTHNVPSMIHKLCMKLSGAVAVCWIGSLPVQEKNWARFCCPMLCCIYIHLSAWLEIHGGSVL